MDIVIEQLRRDTLGLNGQTYINITKKLMKGDEEHDMDSQFKAWMFPGVLPPISTDEDVVCIGGVAVDELGNLTMEELRVLGLVVARTISSFELYDKDAALLKTLLENITSIRQTE